jgi:hypothetical protein
LREQRLQQAQALERDVTQRDGRRHRANLGVAGQ